MNDDTRKLLKVFGVAVTDAEAEAEHLAGTAAQLSTTTRACYALFPWKYRGLCRNRRTVAEPGGQEPREAQQILEQSA
jgi:hypothetical protein